MVCQDAKRQIDAAYAVYEIILLRDTQIRMQDRNSNRTECQTKSHNWHFQTNRTKNTGQKVTVYMLMLDCILKKVMILIFQNKIPTFYDIKYILKNFVFFIALQIR